MRKKLLFVLLIMVVVITGSLTAYAAFTSGHVYEKNMTMPEDIYNLVTGG